MSQVTVVIQLVAVDVLAGLGELREGADVLDGSGLCLQQPRTIEGATVRGISTACPDVSGTFSCAFNCGATSAAPNASTPPITSL